MPNLICFVYIIISLHFAKEMWDHDDSLNFWAHLFVAATWPLWIGIVLLDEYWQGKENE